MSGLLVLMGSGELTGTMTTTHQRALERGGGGPAVLLDSPYGFQENADELTATQLEYFRDKVGVELAVASYRAAEASTPVETARAVATLDGARFVFAGPGSPSYALGQWRGTPVGEALGRVLRRGGAVVLSSAAACTAGRFAVPVYEIYKVGAAPRWLAGLDLVGDAGLLAAVIPHWNNAEGGTHDTRYAYLGRRRLDVLESRLPPEAVVLGVEEHTALALDMAAGTATVSGRGSAVAPRSSRTQLASGETAPLAELGRTSAAAVVDGVTNIVSESTRQAGSEAFDSALAARDGAGAAAALIGALDAGRTAEAAAMAVRLGEAADAGLADPREAVAPLVEALLGLRTRLRSERRFDLADEVRDHLEAAGVEVRDTPDGVEWSLR
jgi:hypothetical protein